MTFLRASIGAAVLLVASAVTAQPAALTEENLERTAVGLRPELLQNESNYKLWVLKYHCPEVKDAVGNEFRLPERLAALRTAVLKPGAFSKVYEVSLLARLGEYDMGRRAFPVVTAGGPWVIQGTNLPYSRPQMLHVSVGRDTGVRHPAEPCMTHIRPTGAWPTQFNLELDPALRLEWVPVEPGAAEAYVKSAGLREVPVAIEFAVNRLELRKIGSMNVSRGVFTGKVQKVTVFTDRRRSSVLAELK